MADEYPFADRARSIIASTPEAPVSSIPPRDLAVSPDLLETWRAPSAAGLANRPNIAMGGPSPNLAGVNPATALQPLQSGVNPGSREGTIAFWMSQGAPRHVAEGIANRVNVESGYKSGIFGDQGTSAGLYQHHADRLTRLQNFAAQQGKAWTDPLVQHQFALTEVRGGDSIAAQHWNEILTAPDAKTAETLWDKYFERSKYGPGAGGPLAGAGGGRGRSPFVSAGVGSFDSALGASMLGGGGGGEPSTTAAPSSLSRTLGQLSLSPEQPQQHAAQQIPGAVQRRPVQPLQPVPLPQAPNLLAGYEEALAAILNGQRRGMGSAFG